MSTLWTLPARDSDAADAPEARATPPALDDATAAALWPGLVRLGRLLTGSQADGEDLAQQALLGLLRRPAVENPAAYLRRAMVNLTINRARKSERERRHLRSLRDESVPPPDVDDLWPLVRALPERQRAVLVLRYYEDLSEAQIADILGCRPGTVKSTAARALTALRKEVGHD